MGSHCQRILYRNHACMLQAPQHQPRSESVEPICRVNLCCRSLTNEAGPRCILGFEAASARGSLLCKRCRERPLPGKRSGPTSGSNMYRGSFFSSSMDKKACSRASELRSMFKGAAFDSCFLCVKSTAMALKPRFRAA